MSNECKIYISIKRTWIVVSANYYTEFDKYRSAYRRRRQYHNQCCCPSNMKWVCEGDCTMCPYSFDSNRVYSDTEDICEAQPDRTVNIEETVEKRNLLQRVIAKFRELDDMADTIISIWITEGYISDREMARRIGRNEFTFAKQMKRYREEFKKIREI